MAYKDPEKRREQQRRWREANREQIRERKAQYYQDNREASLAASRERYYRDPAAAIKYNREYYQRNRQRLRAYGREYYLRNRDKALAYFTFNHHGMQPEDWAALWDAQDGRCYLCGNELDSSGGRLVAIDHDHSCCGEQHSCRVCRRGLACMDCNIAIGHTREDPDRLRRMADALEAAQLEVEHRKATAGAAEQLLLIE